MQIRGKAFLLASDRL